MKKFILPIALALVSAGALADTASGAAAPSSVSGQQQQQTSSQTTSATSAASNQGNSQNITFTSPPTTTSTVNSTVSGTTTQNVNQTLSGGTTSAITQTVNGDTTARQIVSGGTDSTVHQEFGTQVIKNTPSVNGPPLVSSNDTCMGSASGSVNGPGFGLSLGKTYTDTNCVMLKNAREFWNMGFKAAAMALMCKDPANREALVSTGYKCPDSK